MLLEGITLSKMSQTEKYKYYMISFICWTYKTQLNSYKLMQRVIVPAKMDCNNVTLNIKIQQEAKCLGINRPKDIQCHCNKHRMQPQKIFDHES